MANLDKEHLADPAPEERSSGKDRQLGLADCLYFSSSNLWSSYQAEPVYQVQDFEASPREFPFCITKF
jgi:hypothetical protein